MTYTEARALARDIYSYSPEGKRHMGNYTHLTTAELIAKIDSWNGNGESSNPEVDVKGVPETYNKVDVQQTLEQAISMIDEGIRQLRSLTSGPSIEELRKKSQEILINLHNDDLESYRYDILDVGTSDGELNIRKVYDIYDDFAFDENDDLDPS